MGITDNTYQYDFSKSHLAHFPSIDEHVYMIPKAGDGSGDSCHP